MPSQPTRDFVVVHYVVGNQGCLMVEEHHTPLSMHSDFVRLPGQFAQPQSAMPMWIAKRGPDPRDSFGNLFPHAR
ncbi:MAG TPA: hypothetical protein VK811_06980, partial [Candidatus Acidoferrum sp.]|nr:hypothetical protein [Candidatus Acidoferrum sp.]